MTAKEVIDIVKESNLWATLAPKEKQEAVTHALKITQLSTKEENITNTVGEVYSKLEA
jgi:hypothetical protein